MRTLYRAAKTNKAVRGACFAQEREDAEAYLDNPGFGGPVLYSVDVREQHVFRPKTKRAALAELGDIAKEHGLPAGAPRALRAEGADIDAWFDDASSFSYIHEIVADVSWMRDLLSHRYDWVVYEDSFPPGCITWCYLGDDPIYLESAISAAILKAEAYMRAGTADMSFRFGNHVVTLQQDQHTLRTEAHVKGLGVIAFGYSFGEARKGAERALSAIDHLVTRGISPAIATKTVVDVR